MLRRAVIASTVGTSIEWYDFFLYSTATGLVFANLFFPKSDPAVATLNVFLIYAVGFIAGPKAFTDWGWRVPFYFSILLVAVGLYVRLRVLETPLFQRLLDERKIESAPVAQVIRRNWREILQSAFLRLSEQAPFYLFTAYIFTYAVTPGPLKQTRNFILLALTCGAVLSFASIPFFGYLSDRLGRKRVYMTGVVAMGIWGFVYFGLLDTKVAGLIFLAIFLSLIPHDAQYGPQAALIAASYTGRLRYSGASLGYQLASVFAGGPAPIIATLLFAGGVIPGTSIKVTGYHTSLAIAWYILICAVISLIAVATVKERSKQDISLEYDEQPAAEAVGVGQRPMTQQPQA